MRPQNLALMILLLGAAGTLWSEEEITRIGVVDTNRIYSVYFRDSKAIRDLQELRRNTLDQSAAIQTEIVQLKSAKVDAEREGSKEDALRLESRILEKENFLREYQRVKNLEYRSRLSQVELESSFLSEVTDAIAFVAVSEGFSIIMERQNPLFLYYTVESDITEKVLKHLFEKAGKPYTPGD